MQVKDNAVIEELAAMSMDLKYCERCGGLWLRHRGEEEVFCTPCGHRVASGREHHEPIALGKRPAGRVTAAPARLALVEVFA